MTKTRQDELNAISASRLRRAREKRFNDTRDEKFATAAAFARSMGVKPATYTHHENGNRGFEPADAIKYAMKLGGGFTASYLMGTDKQITETPEVTIMGEAGLNSWVDPRFDKERNKNIRSLPVPNPKGLALRFAIEIKDESVNRAIEFGGYAVCVPIETKELESGQLVCVEHIRDGLVQKTIRRVIARAKGGFQLKTYSSLAQYESTLNFPSDVRNETVTVLGRVIGRYEEIDLVEI